MPTFQDSELLPKREIFQDEIPAASKEADECSDPEVEHATELYLSFAKTPEGPESRPRNNVTGGSA